MNIQSVRIFASAMVTNKVCLAVKSMLSKHSRPSRRSVSKQKLDGGKIWE